MDKPAKSIIAQLFFNQVKIAPIIHSKERITVDRVMPAKISEVISITAITIVAQRPILSSGGAEERRMKRIVAEASAESLADYLRQVWRREPSGTPGHNPLGSLSVILMLLAITTQAVTGLFIESDDLFESAPLAGYVSPAFDQGSACSCVIRAKIVTSVAAASMQPVPSP